MPLLRLFAILMVVGMLGVALWPVSTPDGVATRSQQCKNSLKQIGLAIHNYHDDYGSFPPGFIANPGGEPIHSWRVLILPYIEEQLLYDSYRFNEPWDSPNNSEIGRQIPEVFKCPSFAASRPDSANTLKTTYVIAHSSIGVFNASEPTALDDINDPLDETLLVVEVHRNAVHWLDPVDPSPDKILADLNNSGSHHVGGLHVLFADGTVRHVADGLSEDQFLAMLSIDRGDQVPEM